MRDVLKKKKTFEMSSLLKRRFFMVARSPGVRRNFSNELAQQQHSSTELQLSRSDVAFSGWLIIMLITYGGAEFANEAA